MYSNKVQLVRGCLLLLLAVWLTPVKCANILALLPTLSRSHHIFNRALMQGLAKNGHHVIAVSPDYEESTKNLRYIYLEKTYEKFEAEVSVADLASFSTKENIDVLFRECIKLCEHEFQTEGFKELKSLMNEKFDLLIVEAVVSECFYGFMPHFGVPVVALSAYGYGVWTNDQFGVPDPMAVFPQSVLPYNTDMTFWQRIHNVYLTLYTLYQRHYNYLPEQEKIARKVFGNTMPPLSEIERNYFSIFLTNSGPGTDPSRARPPNVIEVGCLHCHPGKPLPKDIQEFLDGAADGAIFFSLGSNVRSDKLPVQTLKAILTVFSKLKQRIILKWESDTMPSQPANVKLGKWLPQQDILAHPNVRLFITHGGRLSIQESAYHGVPVLAVPVFNDQYLNARRAEDMGMGVRLDLVNVTQESFSSALYKMLGNNKYIEIARQHKVLSQDLPQTPLDTAIFWIEYVIRNNGAPHLRPVTLNFTWYQLQLIDIMAFFLVLTMTLVVVPLIVCRGRGDSSSKKKRN